MSETQNVTEELKDFAESAKKAGLTSGDRVIGRAIARIAELEAVVEKLPKTKDGVPVAVPADMGFMLDEPLWRMDCGTPKPVHSSTLGYEIGECYSTREAALAAKGDGDAN